MTDRAQLTTLNKKRVSAQFLKTREKIKRLNLHTVEGFKPLRLLWSGYLKRNGIGFTFAGINDEGYTASDDFFKQLEHILKDAKEMWICFGQLGARFLERPEFMRGLKHAIRNNSARVYIISGPRVDPESKEIMELVDEGLVKLFPIEKYPSDHFMVIEQVDGRNFLIEESPHPEAIRGLKDNKPYELYKGFFRLFYIIQDPGWLGQRRKKKAQDRISRSIRNNIQLENMSTRGYDIDEVYRDLQRKFLFQTIVRQPFEILLLTLTTSRRMLPTSTVGGGIDIKESLNRVRIDVYGISVPVSAKHRDNPFVGKKPKGQKASTALRLTKVIIDDYGISVPVSATHADNPFISTPTRKRTAVKKSKK